MFPDTPAETPYWRDFSLLCEGFSLKRAQQLKVRGMMTLDSCFGSSNGEYRAAIETFELQHKRSVGRRGRRALEWQVRSADQSSCVLQGCFDRMDDAELHKSTNNIDKVPSASSI